MAWPDARALDYPAFLSDAMIWNAIQGLVGNVSDQKVRAAIETGLATGLKAMQAHAGTDVEIRPGEARAQ